jgi:hypothetical protein
MIVYPTDEERSNEYGLLQVQLNAAEADVSACEADFNSRRDGRAGADVALGREVLAGRSFSSTLLSDRSQDLRDLRRAREKLEEAYERRRKLQERRQELLTPPRIGGAHRG